MKNTLCIKGFRLRREWADRVQAAPRDDWQKTFFENKGYWNHVKSCKQCQKFIKERREADRQSDIK